jgi:GxxExxY protein
MHALFVKADRASHERIGAAMEVHRLKGPGLIESIYERCLMHELSLRWLSAVNQRLVRVEYKRVVFEEPLRFDMLVEECVLLELKSVQQVLPIHKAQLLSYMNLINVPLGLVINFHEMKLIDGIHRMILPGANKQWYGSKKEVGSHRRKRSCSLSCKLLFHKSYSPGLATDLSTRLSTQEPCFFWLQACNSASYLVLVANMRKRILSNLCPKQRKAQACVMP